MSPSQLAGAIGFSSLFLNLLVLFKQIEQAPKIPVAIRFEFLIVKTARVSLCLSLRTKQKDGQSLILFFPLVCMLFSVESSASS